MELFLTVKCTSNKELRKSKGPKLLFNTSIHSLPMKIVQDASRPLFKSAYMNTKGKVTAVLGRPHYKSNKKSHNVKLWRVLLDSGSDGDILFVKRGARDNVPYTKRLVPQLWQTSMGVFKTEKLGEFDLTFPEYSGSKRLSLQPDIMEFDAGKFEPKFDLIIGTETMRELGIVLDFGRQMIMIDQIDLPMRKISELQKPNVNYQIYKNNEPVATAELTKRATKILDAKYEKADLPAIVKNCVHLTEDQREKLLQTLLLRESLFDGTLGEWDTEPVHFELKEGAKPFHGRAYPIPRIHQPVTKKEVNRLCDIGVLKWEGESEWDFSQFYTA